MQLLLEYFVDDYELTINHIAQKFGGRKLRQSATQKHFGRNDIDRKSLVRFVKPDICYHPSFVCYVA